MLWLEHQKNTLGLVRQRYTVTVYVTTLPAFYLIPTWGTICFVTRSTHFSGIAVHYKGADPDSCACFVLDHRSTAPQSPLTQMSVTFCSPGAAPCSPEADWCSPGLCTKMLASLVLFLLNMQLTFLLPTCRSERMKLCLLLRSYFCQRGCCCIEAVPAYKICSVIQAIKALDSQRGMLSIFEVCNTNPALQTNFMSCSKD